jgi:hypothetical protein
MFITAEKSYRCRDAGAVDISGELIEDYFCKLCV